MASKNMLRIIFFILFLFSIKLSAAENSKPYLAFIKDNAMITSLEDNSVKKINRGIYAHVQAVDPLTRSQFYIYSKGLKAKYKVSSTDVVEIKDDIELLPNETGDIYYPAKSNFRAINKIFPIESELSLAIDQLDLAPVNQFLDTEISSISAPRYKFSSHYISSFNTNIGFNINLQSASWRDELGNDSKLSSLSFGPEFKFNYLHLDDYTFSALVSYEFCSSYKIKSNLGEEDFSTYLWNIGLHNEAKTQIGTIIFGADLRKYFLTHKRNTNGSLALKVEEYVLTSAGLFLGYKIEWDL
jgi:hypothetical protein